MRVKVQGDRGGREETLLGRDATVLLMSVMLLAGEPLNFGGWGLVPGVQHNITSCHPPPHCLTLPFQLHLLSCQGAVWKLFTGSRISSTLGTRPILSRELRERAEELSARAARPGRALEALHISYLFKLAPTSL
jgi:hypothetical protein